MTAKHMLGAINTLNLNAMDVDMLEAVCTSLNMILDMDTFNGNLQEAAFCKLTEVKEAIGIRKAEDAAQADNAAAFEKAFKKFLDKNTIDFDNSTDNDKIIRLMICAEEDGTLSFVFKGVRWDWNHNTNVWDMTPVGDEKK